MTNWKSFKNEHLALSSAVAEKYDSFYSISNYATSSYMRFESDTIQKFLPKLENHTAAVDIGCGTGRISMLLSNFFDHVDGLDFSPDMITIANRNKEKFNAEKIDFHECDVEDPNWPLKLKNVDLVNTAFGMGSFVHDPNKLLFKIKSILSPNGLAFLSFYNTDCLAASITLPWKPSMSSRIINGKNLLEVQFNGSNFKVSAKAYTVNEIKSLLKSYFNILEISTYPALSALLPNEAFNQPKIREFCEYVDKLLAENNKLAAGPFIFAVCQNK